MKEPELHAKFTDTRLPDFAKKQRCPLSLFIYAKRKWRVTVQDGIGNGVV